MIFFNHLIGTVTGPVMLAPVIRWTIEANQEDRLRFNREKPKNDFAESIIEEAAKQFNLSVRELTHRKRGKAYVSDARTVTVAVFKELTGYPNHIVGQFFGDRKDCTIFCSLERFRKGPDLWKDEYTRLKNTIRTKMNYYE